MLCFMDISTLESGNPVPYRDSCVTIPIQLYTYLLK
jgi:hypothetical protein